jgi:hypothetical protein
MTAGVPVALVAHWYASLEFSLAGVCPQNHFLVIYLIVFKF